MIGWIANVWLAGLCFCLTFAASAAQPATSTDSASPIETYNQTTSQENHAVQTRMVKDGPQGMRAYKDPKTGKLGPAPREKHPRGASVHIDETVSTESHDLLEVLSPVPGGGVMVDLKDRFRSYASASKDANGRITIYCAPEPVSERP